MINMWKVAEFRFAIFAIVAVFGCSSTYCSGDEESPVEQSRGDVRLEQAPSTARPYRKTWAIIVGINYEKRAQEFGDDSRSKAALPPLKNAVNDAMKLDETLRKYYGYAAKDLTEVTVLVESDATKQKIDEAIGNMCDKNIVSEEDSVLIFLSGHGIQTGNSRLQTVFLAYDVRLSQGKPVANYVRLQQDLVERLDECPARHKLVILDHCFSGDIFNGSFQPSSKGERNDLGLSAHRAFQAMASCRATQPASDGPATGSGSNSPFSHELIEGLKRLPAITSKRDRIGVNRILDYIKPNFTASAQKPDCRSFNGFEGEFAFLPANNADFSEFLTKAEDQDLLAAMVTGNRGKWWFDERPWFIPGLRQEILKKWTQISEKKRASSAWSSVDVLSLQKAEEDVLNHSSVRADLKDYCIRLRKSFGKDDEYALALESIEKELTTRLATVLEGNVEGNPIQASDLHLLALVRHAIGKKIGVEEVYRRAIAEYESETESSDSTRKVLAALCRADYAEFLFDRLTKYHDAAEQYRLAESTIGHLGSQDQKNAAAVFRIFVLCRQAESLRSVNRRKAANDCLTSAQSLARLFADKRLMAHVMKTQGWTQMVEWDIANAQTSFQNSNHILRYLIASSNDSIKNADESQIVTLPDDGFLDSSDFYNSDDFDSKIAYFHNLHGIAMTLRFSGDSASAATKYRRLVRNLEITLADQVSSSANKALEEELIERIVNSEERLGDCNLFGNPTEVDVRQAVDDYRRARSLVHRLKSRKEQSLATLLFKQAIALSIKSQVQDSELAQQLCDKATTIYSDNKEAASGLFEALGEIAPHLVNLLYAKANQEDGKILDQACEKLRNSIVSYREKVGQYPQRDQLELLLFASRVLTEIDQDLKQRYQVLEDADLLHSFCRLALAPIQSMAGKTNHESNAKVWQTAYLRSYYDAILRAKLSTNPTHVLELLELQEEATLGTIYVKPESQGPVLAIYFASDSECYLICDLPDGTSRCTALSSMYSKDLIVDNIVNAKPQKLPLPRQIEQHLVKWLANDGKANDLRLQFEDNVQLGTRSFDVATQDGEYKVAKKAAIDFPFELPNVIRGRVLYSSEPLSQNNRP